VAAGGLSPANIASPLRAVLRRQRNVRVLLGEVTTIDVKQRQVLLAGHPLPYDYLIVAAGARHHYFGHPEWEAVAPGLKTIEDATTIRRKVFTAFEEAERETDPARQQALMTFFVIGGGPTGVELAGAVAELAHHTLRGNFRSINPARAQVVLLEAGERILAAYPPALSTSAERSLIRLGVTVRTRTSVIDVHPERVTLKIGDHTEVVRTHTILWGAGVQASPLAALLASATGAELDRAGRIQVLPDCTLPLHPEVFVIGDMANFSHQTAQPLPGLAQVAMQQGAHAARTIERRMRGQSSLVFHYKDFGSMATIGRSAAVADLRVVRLTGHLAWLAWLFVHLLSLIAFENRMLVLFQWAWNYFTWNRSARLITGTEPKPPA
jgi:NADH dehydrogenase